MKVARSVRLNDPVLGVVSNKRYRLTWIQALGVVASMTTLAVGAGGAAITRTDPDQAPNLGTGLWWALTTVTTVGYGDVVPASSTGRLIGATLMLVGIASIACLTAVAASAIVVREVAEQEREIEREEHVIENAQERLNVTLGVLDQRLARIEAVIIAQNTRDPTEAQGANGAPHRTQ